MSRNKLIKSVAFGEVQCDIYRNNDEYFMTREQIGRALEYSEPQDAIRKIHGRKPERLDKYSATVKLTATDGKAYETTVYNRKGIMEICCHSNQPKADAFMDWVWEVIESIITGKKKIANNTEFDTTKLSPQMQLFNQMYNVMAANEIRINQLEQQTAENQKALSVIKDTIIQRDEDWRGSLNKMFNTIVEHSESKDFRETRNYTYKILEERAHCRLGVKLSNLKERLFNSGATKTAINNANKLDVIESDPRLKEIYTNIVKELAVQYAIRGA